MTNQQRRALAQLEKAYDAGQLSSDEYDRAMRELNRKISEYRASKNLQTKLTARSHRALTWNARDRRWDY